MLGLHWPDRYAPTSGFASRRKERTIIPGLRGALARRSSIKNGPPKGHKGRAGRNVHLGGSIPAIQIRTHKSYGFTIITARLKRPCKREAGRLVRLE